MEKKLRLLFNLFLHEMLLDFNFFLAGINRGSLDKILAEYVVGGNSVQLGSNFPAKSLRMNKTSFLSI